MPQLAIRLRKQDLERCGLDAVDVLNFIRTAYQGDEVGQAYDANRAFPVNVILAPKSRQSITQVSELRLRTPNGTYVQLKQLADIYQTSGHYRVLHQGARRVQTITANVAGRDVASFVAVSFSSWPTFRLPSSGACLPCLHQADSCRWDRWWAL